MYKSRNTLNDYFSINLSKTLSNYINAVLHEVLLLFLIAEQLYSATANITTICGEEIVISFIFWFYRKGAITQMIYKKHFKININKAQGHVGGGGGVT